MKHIKIFENFEELGIEKDQLTIEFLNRLLSNHFVLFMKTWNFHWNVVGPKFKSTHTYLNDLYDQLFENVDSIAERIRQLNGKPIGTLAGYLENAEIVEYSDDEPTPDELTIYKKVLEDYEFIIREMRNFLTTEGLDSATDNLLSDLLVEHEKDAWMLRSLIK